MIPVLLVCHGSLAEGFIDAVSRIMGRQEALEAQSNEGLSLDGLTEQVGHWLRAQQGPTVILVDFPGSSCFRAAMLATRATGLPATIVTGVNLGMLLSFLGKRSTIDAGEIADTLIRDGHRAMQCGRPRGT